eukprot:gene19872-biopygen2530
MLPNHSIQGQAGTSWDRLAPACPRWPRRGGNMAVPAHHAHFSHPAEVLPPATKSLLVEIDSITIVSKSGVPTVVAHHDWNTGFDNYGYGPKRRPK